MASSAGSGAVSMEDRLSDKRFVIVAHRVFPSIVDDLKRYLLKHRVRSLSYMIHEFMNLPSRRSFIERYRSGEPVATHYSFDYRFLPEPLVNMKDFLYTLFWLAFRVRRADVYIGLGGFDVVPGILLKRLLGIKKIVFYTIDYVPVRFESRILNEIYHRVDRFAVRHSTETWNLSPRMAEGREQVRGMVSGEFPHQVVVPIGVWFDEVKRFGPGEYNEHELIFIGHLVEKAGVQVIIEAVPRIAAKIPDFTFRVIGTGPYEQHLKALTEDLGAGDHVVFEGPVHDQDEANEKLARAALAVALYDRKTDDFTYYADPGKLKTYLGAGLPILLTDLPHNARELESREAGLVVDYDTDAVALAVAELMSDERRLARMRESAVSLARELDWNRIFSQNLGRLL